MITKRRNSGGLFISKKDILNLLGICKKSGNIVFGKEPIKNAIYNKKSIIVVLAEDAGRSLRDYLLGLCKRENVVTIVLKEINKKQLGRSIGKSEISAVGVTDRILSNKILERSKSGGVVSVQDPCIRTCKKTKNIN